MNSNNVATIFQQLLRRLRAGDASVTFTSEGAGSEGGRGGSQSSGGGDGFDSGMGESDDDSEVITRVPRSTELLSQNKIYVYVNLKCSNQKSFKIIVSSDFKGFSIKSRVKTENLKFNYRCKTEGYFYRGYEYSNTGVLTVVFEQRHTSKSPAYQLFMADTGFF